MNHAYVAVATGALVMGGCAATLSNTEGRQNVLQQAAFDLSCPQPTLKLYETQRVSHAPNGTFVQAYGVQGCGVQATYVKIDEAWVLNALRPRDAAPGAPPSAGPFARPVPSAPPAPATSAP